MNRPGKAALPASGGGDGLTAVRWRCQCAGLAVICFLAVVAAGCAGDRSADGRDRVRAVLLPFLTLTPMHIAAERGHFERHGLDVEFVRVAGIQGLMTALARGEVDASGGMFTVNLLNTIASGLRVRMVAAPGILPGEGCSTHGFVARKELLDSGALEDPEQLRRLKYDADVFIPHGYWLEELIGPLGVTVDELDLTNLPETASAEALRRGSVDVAAVAEPFFSMARAVEGVAVWRYAGQLVPDYPVSVLLYGPTLLDERPEVGERFATAILEAIRDFAAGPTEQNLASVSALTGLDTDQLSRVCWPTPPLDGRVDASLFRGFQEWAVAHGLSERVLADAEMVDHRFIDAATAALSR